jgi:arylformamidase
MRVEGVRGGRISINDLPSVPTAPRLLFATGTFDGFEAWNDDFCGLEPSLVDHLAACGVRLVGVDAPSVDLMSDPSISAHQRFYANDMAILEGLALRDVPAGRYELIALPLNLVGFDGSPIRAILRTVEP